MSQLLHVERFLLVADRGGAVTHFHGGQAVVVTNASKIVELSLDDVLLEQRATEIGTNAMGLQDVDFASDQGVGHGRSPPKFDEVDQRGERFDDVLKRTQRYSGINHHRHAMATGL